MPPAPNRLMTTAPSSGTRFRPCLDLHDGQVKQIVGGTLSDDRRELQTNFVSPHPPRYFVEKYRTDDLRGGLRRAINPEVHGTKGVETELDFCWITRGL